jgi:hypothetical protein
MQADDLTRGQARAIKNKLEPMVSYLNRLGKRMSDRGFPLDDPARVMVVDALKALYKLRAEMQCRSIDGRGIEEEPKPPTIDELLARKSAPRKDEKIRLGRVRRETH